MSRMLRFCWFDLHPFHEDSPDTACISLAFLFCVSLSEAHLLDTQRKELLNEAELKLEQQQADFNIRMGEGPPKRANAKSQIQVGGPDGCLDV